MTLPLKIQIPDDDQIDQIDDIDDLSIKDTNSDPDWSPPSDSECSEPGDNMADL